MKILLLGGTGAMGDHLADLLKDDNEVFVTTRNSSKRKEKVSYIIGNARDFKFLENLLAQEWDVIVDFMVYTTEEFRQRVDYLLAACKHYIYLSSSRVYSNVDSIITEDTPRLLDISKDLEYLSTDEYALTKARQENLLKENTKNNWTIIRPYITYSHNRLQLGILEKEEWLYRTLKGRTIVFSKEMMSKQTTLTYGLDVSKGIKAIMGKRDAMNRAFHITQSTAVSWEEVLDVYKQTIKNAYNLDVKVKLLYLSDFMNIAPRKAQIKYDRLYDRVFDNSNINQFISTEEWMTPLAGIEENLKRFLAHPDFLKINWGSEAVKDKYTNEFSKLNEIESLKTKLKYLIKRFK